MTVPKVAQGCNYGLVIRGEKRGEKNGADPSPQNIA